MSKKAGPEMWFRGTRTDREPVVENPLYPQKELSSRRGGRRDPVFRRSSAICRFAASLAVIVAVSVSHGTDLHAKDKSRTPVASSIKGLTVSPEELRVRVRALIRPTLGIIEQGADGIIASTSDPAVRRGALILKIETTTTMLAAMLRSDPVAALADAWGYLMQVENLLARPEAEARFGPSARRASETLQLAEVQFRNLVASVQGGRFAESFPAYLKDAVVKSQVVLRQIANGFLLKDLDKSAPQGKEEAPPQVRQLRGGDGRTLLGALQPQFPLVHPLDQIGYRG